MSILRTLVSLAVIAMLNKAMAANYTVGAPNGGWDTSSDLQTWASSQSFAIGDNLIFVYTINHDVVEVTKANYDSCQSSSPVQSYTGGNTVIPLASAGKRYFICGTSGHCSQGMKVEIDTLAASAPPPSSPASPPPSSIPPTASPATPPAASPPAHSPHSAPTLPPASKVPVGSPKSSLDVPSTESPASSPPLSDPSPPPPPSLASKVNIFTGFTAGVGLVTMMLLTL
ncbi:uclacyanin 1-like [Cornus florida]|uniref:uclacyanin 1-like n=1 Tax=Cornus florida TaxID=4283 RepID=UPI002899E29E|nr:uclacyanin 1-like [Cornus florida]XP_059661041.1 uclacyanin 1-like [Cornus florida]